MPSASRWKGQPEKRAHRHCPRAMCPARRALKMRHEERRRGRHEGGEYGEGEQLPLELGQRQHAPQVLRGGSLFARLTPLVAAYPPLGGVAIFPRETTHAAVEIARLASKSAETQTLGPRHQSQTAHVAHVAHHAVVKLQLVRVKIAAENSGANRARGDPARRRRGGGRP